MDFLERQTTRAVGVLRNDGVAEEKTTDDVMSELLDDLMNDEGIFYEMRCPSFRNVQKILTVSSKHTIMLGRNACGVNYCITPEMDIPWNISVIQERDSSCSNEAIDCCVDLTKINSLVG